MARSPSRFRLSLSIACTALSLVGCDRVSRARLTGVGDEQIANQVIAVLERATGSTQIAKEQQKKGSEWVILVPTELLQDARAVWDLYKPRWERRASMGNYPAAQGMFPTPAEERARAQAALGGSIETALLAIDRVIDARVNVSLPETDSLRPNDRFVPSASVIIKYVASPPDATNELPIGESDVRQLIALSVPGLSPEKVKVTYSAVAAFMRRSHEAVASAGDTSPTDAGAPRDSALFSAGYWVLGTSVIGLILLNWRSSSQLQRLRRGSVVQAVAL